MSPMYCWKAKPIVRKQYLRFIFGLGQLCESCPSSTFKEFLILRGYRIGASVRFNQRWNWLICPFQLWTCSCSSRVLHIKQAVCRHISDLFAEKMKIYQKGAMLGALPIFKVTASLTDSNSKNRRRKRGRGRKEVPTAPLRCITAG